MSEIQPTSPNTETYSDEQSRRPIVPKKYVSRTLAERYEKNELEPRWQELCDWATD